MQISLVTSNDEGYHFKLYEDNVAYGNTTLVDNKKLKFGDDGDLQIHHDSNHSYIDELGTGNLYIRNGTKNSIFARTDAEVILYHNGSGKLATNSGGVTVTGGMTADSLSVDSLGMNGTSISSSGLPLRSFCILSYPPNGFSSECK